MSELNIGIVGTQFMGRAHSNAYLDVAHYFDLPVKPIMRAACDSVSENLTPFIKKYDWLSSENDYKKLVKRDDIDLIDICTSNITHMPIAIEAAKNGKHIICEKPMCINSTEARQMLDAAEEAGVKHMVGFNYRRVPALVLAQKMIKGGKIGKIHHFNAVYYQDWLVDPNFPMVWRHDKIKAGSGAHGDMNAHTIDLARFLVGEFEAVSAMQDIFVKQRPFANGTGYGEVTADDAFSFLAKFTNGAIGNFIATRFATGRKNFLRLEIFGSEGSLSFNLERMNELNYYSRNDESFEQGFRNIIVTESNHPYIDMWWPPGHIIGWEHTFIHEIGDMLLAISNDTEIRADFKDGLKCQQVLDAASKSAIEQKWEEIPI